MRESGTAQATGSRPAARGTLLPLAAIAAIALLVFLTACGGDDGDDTTAATTTTQETTATEAGGGGAGAEGSTIFAENCASCHGSDGSGGFGPSLQNRSDLSVERVTEQVTNGGGEMPSFEGQLSEEQIAAVADYVSTQIAGN